MKNQTTIITMIKYGEAQSSTGTLSSKGIAQIIKTAEFLRKGFKHGDRILICASPRDIEVQTANIIREELGLMGKVQVLPWLYVLESGHIVVDNLMVNSFIEQNRGNYDHIIVIASTEHVEGWPSFITGKYGVRKIPNGHCVTVGGDGTLTYSNN